MHSHKSYSSHSVAPAQHKLINDVLKNYQFFNINTAKFDQINHRVKRLSRFERFASFSAYHVITVTSFLISSALALVSKKLVLGEKSQNTYGDIYFLLFATLGLSCIPYIEELKRTKDRTKFAQQNVNPSYNQMSQVLKSLEQEYPDILNEWKSTIKIKSLSQAILHMKQRLKKGICFGYTISAIDYLCRFPTATGRQVVDNLDYDVAIKKGMLQIIKDDLEEYENSTGNMRVILDVRQTTTNHFIRLLYQTKSISYLNNTFPEIMDIKSISTERLIDAFALSLKNEFISISQYAIGDLNRINIDGETLLNDDEKNRINEIEKSNNTNPAEKLRFSFFKSYQEIENYKSTLNLGLRQRNFINTHVRIMHENTVLAGEIILKSSCGSLSHSIMFRCSNKLYYFFDSNYGVNEYETMRDFFIGLQKHIIDYYSPECKDLAIKFISHALCADDITSDVKRYPQPQVFPGL